jgi:squalene-hopene/tetraprenyl-beta-curcumene cyclase
MKRAVLVVVLLGAVALGWAGVRATRSARAEMLAHASTSSSWDPAAAAGYLDARETWWQSWPPAQKEQGTVCISCHTVVPYALVRPALRATLRESQPPQQESLMLASVDKRVGDWSHMTPFYTDAIDGPGKAAGSHATEAVLNAVILTHEQEGSQAAAAALEEAWALQKTTGDDAGGWDWQNFHLAPWESNESAYQGAALFAVAVGKLPTSYRTAPGVAAHVQLLQDYLRRRYAHEPLMSQVYVLWASARMPSLLTSGERQSLISQLQSLQLPDGGWALITLDRQPGIGRSLNTDWQQVTHNLPSDGCATGLVVLALEEAGIDAQTPALRRGLAWLQHHQAGDGGWWAPSLNGGDDGYGGVAKFMDDAATGYAVMALEAAQSKASDPQKMVRYVAPALMH